MDILGISAFYHDSAAVLLRDGKIVAAAQEERFSRKKHDERFPTRAIEYCLEAGGISISDVSYVVFYEKPFLKFERLLDTYLAYAPRGIASFMKAMPVWLKEKLWIKDIIARELGYSGKILFSEHHLSHAASAFFPSPFMNAAVLTMDGAGEWATASYGIGDGNTLKLLGEMRFPHSLGLLYSAFTYYVGFRVNSGEYKLMGLAPYGAPKYKAIILKEIVDIRDDGSFTMNMDYFNFTVGLTMTNQKFHDLFGGPPRRPESKLTQRDMDIARSIQEVTEEIVLRMARHVRRETGSRNLCLAGGVALNCVANSKILSANIFDNLWVQPAAGDAGGALGAAFAAWHGYLSNKRAADEVHDAMQGSLLGPSYSDSEIRAYLDSREIPYTHYNESDLIDNVVDFINKGSVVGWFHGRMEFGPRALGARSIIGDARNPEMQSTMNLKIKFRENFRPFAPSILAEHASEYFNIKTPSPYMSFVADVKESQRLPTSSSPQNEASFESLKHVRSRIPAVTHIDYSARLQTVHSETSPRYHKLLSRFNQKYGCPLVANTSFNIRGEPIVCTPEEAYRCFMRTQMDYLVLENCVLAKRAQPTIRENSDRQNEFEMD